MDSVWLWELGLDWAEISFLIHVTAMAMVAVNGIGTVSRSRNGGSGEW